VILSASSLDSQSSVTDQLSGLRLGKLDVPGAYGTSTPLSDQSSVGAEPSSQSQGENALAASRLNVQFFLANRIFFFEATPL